MPRTITLEGLRPEPLAAYCAALAVLRLVSEQADPEAQGWWQNERFVLQSQLDADSLVNFFLHDYHPTPIASPWNAGGGFFARPSDSSLTKIERSDNPRFGAYREAIAIIIDTLKEHNLEAKPSTPALKFAFLKSLQASLPIDARRWLDAVVSLEGAEADYHPLFLAGGNDGRVDFAKNLMDRLARLLLEPDPDSQVLLHSALFDTITDQLEPLTAGPHNPGSIGGPNASSEELEAKPLSNPWTYILGMEGALLLSKGLGKSPHRNVGYPSAIAKESRMDDLWLPLWSSPRTLAQVQEQLAGQAQTLRYSFLPRNGRNHFAVPVSRREQPLKNRPAYVLDLEDQVRQRSRELEEALQAEPLNPARILEALCALGLHKWERPPTLPQEWIAAAEDGTPEFGCALALSGLGRGESKPELDLKHHLNHFAGPDLCHRMLGLLRVRTRHAHQILKSPTRGGYPRFNAPFWSSHPTLARHIEAFLAERLDEARIQRLLFGLCLVKSPPDDKPAESAFLPYPYAIAKLAFHQRNDRRPARVEIADAMAVGQLDTAVGQAVHFLTHRHPEFPQSWPPCPPLNSRTSQRWAAALLFPISDATYDQILGGLLDR